MQHATSIREIRKKGTFATMTSPIEKNEGQQQPPKDPLMPLRMIMVIHFCIKYWP
jgi:hypothetical protein